MSSLRITIKNKFLSKGDAEGDDIQFMLSELDHTRQQLRIYMGRFESLITFYLSVLGLIISVILTSSFVNAINLLSLFVFSFFSWGFSLIIFYRLCNTRFLMAQEMAKERKIQEYFLLRNNKLRKYTNPIYKIDEIVNAVEPGKNTLWLVRKKVRKYIFMDQTLLFFYLFALFAGILGITTSDLVLAFALQQSKIQNSDLIWCFVLVSIISGGGSLILCHVIIINQLKKGLRDIRGVFDKFKDQYQKSSQ